MQKSFILVFRTKFHDAFDTRTVVPAAVENHDLACRGKMLDVALKIELGLLPLRWRRQRDHAKDTWAHSFGNALDDSALAGGITPLEDDDGPHAFRLDPALEFDQLSVQFEELRLVLFCGELLLFWRGFFCHLHRFGFGFVLAALGLLL